MGTGHERAKKHSGKRAYLNNFERGEDGTYAYNGQYQNCHLTPEAYRREMTVLLLAALISVALSFAAGCFTGTGMEGCFYLLLPYAGGLVVMVRTAWALIQMFHAGPRLRSYIYDKTAGALPRKTAFSIILSVAALAGLIYAAVIGAYTGRGVGAVLFVISRLAEFLAGVLIRKRSENICWNVE